MPERRRPDRNLAGAHAARDRVLARMVSAGLIDQHEADRAAAEEVAGARRALPALAPHAAGAALKNAPSEHVHQLTISKRVQEGLETVAREAAKKLGPKLSVAMVLADAETGEILGEVGSSDFFDASRSGWIDMTRTIRSPGSTLKPFIYGLAMEQGLVAQETLIEDRPTDFGGYRPRNFDMSYQGDVSVRQALQLSLNVPAVRLLDAVGPARLTARFRQVGVAPQLPLNEPPGLAIGLGGVGVTLRDLVQLYTGLSNGGQVKPLHDGTEPAGTRAVDRRHGSRRAGRLADRRHPVRRQAARRRAGARHRLQDRHQLRLPRRLVGRLRRPLCARRLGRPARRRRRSPACRAMSRPHPCCSKALPNPGLAAVPLRAAPAGAFRPKREELPVTMERFASARRAGRRGADRTGAADRLPARRRPRRSRRRERQRLARWS